MSLAAALQAYRTASTQAQSIQNIANQPDVEQSYLEAKAAEFTSGVRSGTYDPADWGMSGDTFTASDIADAMNRAGLTAATHYERYGRNENIPGFAIGGMHPGGWRVVGEQGPELEYTGASKIFSNAQSRNMLDTSALEQQIKSLHTDIKAAQFQIARNTGKSAKLLDRWDGDGLPEERVV
jgi:hypothetical protein